MIAFLHGQLRELVPTYAIVDCQGVGYRCRISLQTYEALMGKAEVHVHTHFQVKEDSHTLYGFATTAERDVFELLLGVQGVGGSTALLLLSQFQPKAL